jgi:hypothetical protein
MADKKRGKANPLIFWVAGGILVFGFAYTYIRRRNAAIALSNAQSPTPASIDSNNIISLANTNVNDYQTSQYLQLLTEEQQLSALLTLQAQKNQQAAQGNAPWLSPLASPAPPPPPPPFPSNLNPGNLTPWKGFTTGPTLRWY